MRALVPVLLRSARRLMPWVSLVFIDFVSFQPTKKPQPEWAHGSASSERRRYLSARHWTHGVTRGQRRSVSPLQAACQVAGAEITPTNQIEDANRTVIRRDSLLPSGAFACAIANALCNAKRCLHLWQGEIGETTIEPRQSVPNFSVQPTTHAALKSRNEMRVQTEPLRSGGSDGTRTRGLRREGRAVLQQNPRLLQLLQCRKVSQSN